MKTKNIRVLFAVVIIVCFVNTPQCFSQNSVPLWGIWETKFVNDASYEDPYRDVSLDLTFISPKGDTILFWGFYHSNSTWYARFMPDKVGKWKYHATFSDGAFAGKGSFEVIPSDIPGPLCQDVANPLWFGYSGGKHEVVRSLHIGDRFFAENWPQQDRTDFLNWVEAQGYNMLSVASFFLNRNVENRGKGWDTPDLWNHQENCPNPEEFAKAEQILNNLSERQISVYPFAGFFGQSSDFPINSDDQELYIRYCMARLGSYWNLLYNIAGPEPLWMQYKFQNAMPASEIHRLGMLIQELDPFNHLLSIHNETGPDPFRHESWHSYITLQGGKENPADYSVYKYIEKNSRLNKPVYAQEVFWPGNMWHSCNCSNPDSIRKKAFVLMFAGAAINFADMDGNSSSGFSGSLNLNDLHPEYHDAIKAAWDWFDTQSFQSMSPQPNLVKNAYLLAEHGVSYAVYMLDGKKQATLDLTSAPGNYSMRWYKPKTREYMHSQQQVKGNQIIEIEPPSEKNIDWIALIERINPSVFYEKNGIVSIEAENAVAIKDWEIVKGYSNAAMRDNGQREHGFLTYPIKFDNPGRYYIYMLMRRTNEDRADQANDAFVTFAGRKVWASDNVTRPDGIRCSQMEFTWESMPKGPGAHTPRHIFYDPIYVNVPTQGTYTLKIRSRSSGFEIDKIILSQEKEVPTELGSPETLPDPLPG